jgi:hypothetical protein
VVVMSHVHVNDHDYMKIGHMRHMAYRGTVCSAATRPEARAGTRHRSPRDVGSSADSRGYLNPRARCPECKCPSANTATGRERDTRAKIGIIAASPRLYIGRSSESRTIKTKPEPLRQPQQQ